MTGGLVSYAITSHPLHIPARRQAMVTVTKENGKVVFEADGIHTDELAPWERLLAKLWAFKTRLEIPQTHIRGARRDPAISESEPGWLTPVLGGTSIPGRFAYGTFLQHGRRIFWDVRHPEKAIRIDLDHENYDELIVEVENPEEVIRLLTS
jgi:hypothetical protein